MGKILRNISCTQARVHDMQAALFIFAKAKSCHSYTSFSHRLYIEPFHFHAPPCKTIPLCGIMDYVDICISSDMHGLNRKKSLWGKVRSYIQKKRKDRFQRLVESVQRISAFAKDYGITSFGIAAAMVNCAGIQFTGDSILDGRFDQGGKFSDWLRVIDNKQSDHACIQFLVKVQLVMSGQHVRSHIFSAPKPQYTSPPSRSCLSSKFSRAYGH